MHEPAPADAAAATSSAARRSPSTERPQMLTTTTRARRSASAGRSSASPGRRARDPAARRCSACRPRPRAPAGAGLPGQGSTESDLTTTAPSSAQVAVVGQLVAVSRRPRRRHDRVGQRDGSRRAWRAWPPGVRRDRRSLRRRPLGAGCRSWSGAHLERVRPRVGDARRRGPGRGQRREARHLVRHGGRADVLRRRPAGPRPRGVFTTSCTLPCAMSSTASDATPSSPTLATSVSTVEALGAQVAGRARASPRWRSRARRRRAPPRGPAGLSRSASERKTVPASGSRVPAAIWLLAKARPKVLSTPITSPVERISGPSRVSTPGKRSKGSTASFTLTWSSTGTRPTTSARSRPSVAQVGQRLAHHDPGGHHGQRHARRLGHERHRPAGPGVGLEHVDLPVLDRELHVDEAAHAERRRRARVVWRSSVVDHRRRAASAAAARRPSRPSARPASSTCSMTPAIEDLAGAVAHGVDVDLDRVLQEAVDQHGPLGGDAALAGERAGRHATA